MLKDFREFLRPLLELAVYLSKLGNEIFKRPPGKGSLFRQ